MAYSISRAGSSSQHFNTQQTQANQAKTPVAQRPMTHHQMDQALQRWVMDGPPAEQQNRITAKACMLAAHPSRIPQRMELSLINLDLTSLPPEIGQLTQLQTLWMYDNQLTSLPSEIGNLTQLQRLYVYNNKLTSLPPEIGNLTQLQTLHMASNPLTSLPSEIGNLTQLQILNIYGNELTSLPPEIGNLKQLQTLDVVRNQLTSLPPQIGNLTQLQWLDVSENQLASLPPQIGNLTQLVTLYVYNNKLASLPPQIGQLTQLQTLAVARNQLTSLPAELADCRELKSVEFSKNPKLTTIKHRFHKNSPSALKDFWESKEFYVAGKQQTCLSAYGALRNTNVKRVPVAAKTPLVTANPAPKTMADVAFTSNFAPANPSLSADQMAFLQNLMSLFPKNVAQGQQVALIGQNEINVTLATLPTNLKNNQNYKDFHEGFVKVMHYAYAHHMTAVNQDNNASSPVWFKGVQVLAAAPLLQEILSPLKSLLSPVATMNQHAKDSNKGQRFLRLFTQPIVYTQMIEQLGVGLTERLENELKIDPSVLLKKQWLKKQWDSLLCAIDLVPESFTLKGTDAQKLAQQMAVLCIKMLTKDETPADLKNTAPEHFPKAVAQYLLDTLLPTTDQSGTSAVVVGNHGASISAAGQNENDAPAKQKDVQALEAKVSVLAEALNRQQHQTNRMDLMNAQVRTQALTNQQTLTMDHTGSTSASSAAQMPAEFQKIPKQHEQFKQINMETLNRLDAVTDAITEISESMVWSAFYQGFDLMPFTRLCADYFKLFERVGVSGPNGVFREKNGEPQVLVKVPSPLPPMWKSLQSKLEELHGDSDDLYCADKELRKLISKHMKGDFVKTISLLDTANRQKFTRLVKAETNTPSTP